MLTIIDMYVNVMRWGKYIFGFMEEFKSGKNLCLHVVEPLLCLLSSCGELCVEILRTSFKQNPQVEC